MKYINQSIFIVPIQNKSIFNDYTKKSNRSKTCKTRIYWFSGVGELFKCWGQDNGWNVLNKGSITAEPLMLEQSLNVLSAALLHGSLQTLNSNQRTNRCPSRDNLDWNLQPQDYKTAPLTFELPQPWCQVGHLNKTRVQEQKDGRIIKRHHSRKKA